jgi:putative heme iron utilization protein
MVEEPFSPAKTARRVLRLAATGSLATLKDGAPFASLVTVATTPASEPILLLSNLAVHTQNLDRDRRASLLLVEPGGEGGDPLAGARLTLTGTVSERDGDPLLRRRFLARHEGAAGYAGFADFAFYRFEIAAAHLVAGFGRIVALPPDRIRTDCTGADDLIAAEDSAIEHLNADHREALRLYATRLLGLPDGDWRMTGADPEGIDLAAGALCGRLGFPARITTPAELRRVLADLAREARQRAASPKAG